MYYIAMCYISMDLFQQALQTNGKLFSNFEFVLIFGQKTNKFQMNSEA